MRLVPLPAGAGWHFVNVKTIVAVKYLGPKKTAIFLSDGMQFECSEESHAVLKRIEDFVAYEQKLDSLLAKQKETEGTP